MRIRPNCSWETLERSCLCSFTSETKFRSIDTTEPQGHRYVARQQQESRGCSAGRIFGETADRYAHPAKHGGNELSHRQGSRQPAHCGGYGRRLLRRNAKTNLCFRGERIRCRLCLCLPANGRRPIQEHRRGTHKGGGWNISLVTRTESLLCCSACTQRRAGVYPGLPTTTVDYLLASIGQAFRSE